MIHLASQSPQRAMLLQRAGVRFLAIPTTADEDRIQVPQPQLLALERARLKARGGRLPAGTDTAVLLGADTVVALGGELFGKPRDRADAARILQRLAGTTHTVVTGHCLVRLVRGRLDGEASGVAVARVTMRPVPAEEIQAYVDSGESDNRAGAYAIQERGDRFVTDLQGSWETVVGLHVATVARLYRELVEAPLPGYAGAGP